MLIIGGMQDVVPPPYSTPKDALKAAAKAAGGSLTKLGAMLEPPCTGPAISQWDKVPPERAIQIERATGVPRAALRPDLWGAR